MGSSDLYKWCRKMRNLLNHVGDFQILIPIADGIMCMGDLILVQKLFPCSIQARFFTP